MAQAHADCAADATIADTQRAYAKAQQFERDGDKAAAFANYVAAQEGTCDANPVETAAAKRAAALALTLGAAAEREGNFERAFEIYDSGGQYTAADRVLMAWVRSQPDSRAVFEKARQELDYRAMPAFQSNNAVRAQRNRGLSSESTAFGRSARHGKDAAFHRSDEEAGRGHARAGTGHAEKSAADAPGERQE